MIIGNGSQYQLLMSYKHGRISIGVELKDDPIEIAGTVAKQLIPTILLGFYGIGLLIAPDKFSSFWPWPIDDFHGRVYSVLYITPATGALLLFGAAASIELLTMGLTQFVGAGIAIVGLVIIDNQVDKIDWSASGTWLWIGSFVIILLTGAGLIWQSRVRSRSEVSLAAADSA